MTHPCFHAFTALHASLALGLTDDAAASELRASAGVVVYLAQFSKQHSTYAGRDLDNIQRLNRSLGLLYEHYLNAHPADVIIYYGHGEPGPSPAEEKVRYK